LLKGGNDLDDQNDLQLDDRTEQADLASSQDDLKQADCGNSQLEEPGDAATPMEIK
jgi:hypothetical protein